MLHIQKKARLSNKNVTYHHTARQMTEDKNCTDPAAAKSLRQNFSTSSRLLIGSGSQTRTQIRQLCRHLLSLAGNACALNPLSGTTDRG
jgi:hypothetical protein